MKTRRFKTVLLVVFTFTVTATLNAQRATRNAKSRTGYGANTGYGNTTAGRDTTKKKTNTPARQSSGYGNTSGYGSSNSQANSTGGAQSINQNLPIKVIKSSGSGIGDSVAPSLRTDNSIDRQLVKERTPLPYEHIREDDAVYKQRVW
ncbi:MAG: hypothetical protein ACR2KZ_16165, partial [Segetibacter sp.]